MAEYADITARASEHLTGADTDTDTVIAASARARTRRTKADIDAIKQMICTKLEAEQPATVRHVFYLVASTGLVDKAEGEYQRTIVRLLAELRRDGFIPWSWIADNTRFIRKPRTFGGVASAIKHTAETYRRAMWDDQPVYVEVWCEKDAISGVVMDVTSPFDVPLMVCRGYPSLTFVQSAAANISEIGKPSVIYHLGDADPSGRDIPRYVEKQIRDFAPDADIAFIRLAVTDEQIEEMNLPTRPTKKTDTRARQFSGESVDIDSVPPTKLRAIVEEAITSHIDAKRWNKLIEVEAQEREHLERMTSLIGGGA